MDPDFDEFLHVPARLSIVALLAPAGWVDFGFLRDTIETSDSALSKQVSALASAGYVTVRKGRDDGVRRTHVRLSPQGRAAFQRHAAALDRLVASVRAASTAPTSAAEPVQAAESVQAAAPAPAAEPASEAALAREAEDS